MNDFFPGGFVEHFEVGDFQLTNGFDGGGERRIRLTRTASLP